MKVTIKKEIFNEAFQPYLKDDTPVQIFFGGSSSGKSVFLSQRCVIDLMSGGRNYLITRNVADTLRVSVYNEIYKTIHLYGLEQLFKINKTEMSFTCINGYQAILKGLDDTEKIKSITPLKGVFTDIWAEEATEDKKDDIKQLVRRMRGKSKKKKRLTLSFNPILKSHWMFKEWFKGKFNENDTTYKDDKLSILKTTYKDNKFLGEEEIDTLENETDEYWYNVYTLGNWGILGDVIFKNWKVEDLSEQISYFDNIRNGLDFGYSKDPASYVRMHYDPKKEIIYIFRELYQTGLTNPMLAQELKPIVGNERVTGDSAEPKSIQELNDEGIDVVGAMKGKDSVNFGIQWLRGKQIIIDKSCQNTINEYSLYHWKKDKWGNSLPIPIDKDNHAIDATRYGMENDMENNEADCWTMDTNEPIKIDENENTITMEDFR